MPKKAKINPNVNRAKSYLMITPSTDKKDKCIALKSSPRNVLWCPMLDPLLNFIIKSSISDHAVLFAERCAMF